MKKWFGILFSVLLLWMQAAPAPASSLTQAECVQTAGSMAECSKICGGCMDCCVTHAESAPRPSSATPSQSTPQQQLTLLFPAIVAWTMPGKPANAISSASVLSSIATASPLYERNCTLLI